MATAFRLFRNSRIKIMLLSRWIEKAVMPTDDLLHPGFQDPYRGHRGTDIVGRRG